MQRFSIAVILMAALLLTAGCTGIAPSGKRIPSSLKTADQFSVEFEVGKCLYDQFSSTYYIMESSAPKIHLRRNGALVNTLGGFGADKLNFSMLRDIALDNEGNLLALDGFLKVVRKFSPDGKWLADLELPNLVQPARFCVSPEGDLIIYDESLRELLRISGFDGRTVYFFGKFQVDSVSLITANREEITVTSSDGKQTSIFTGMGMFLTDKPGIVVADKLLNRYTYRDGALRHSEGSPLLPLGWQDDEVRLFASGRSLILVKGNNVIRIEPDYAER